MPLKEKIINMYKTKAQNSANFNEKMLRYCILCIQEI